MNSRNSTDNSARNLKVERSDFAVILEESRKQKEFTDVQLQVGDKLIDAHRVVLSAYSPVLKAAISDQWSTTKICSISAEFVDPEIVEDLVGFLYTGNIQLTPDNVHSVCMAASYLQIAGLLEPSVEYLSRLISVENVLTLFEFSFNSQLESLRLPCLRFIRRNHKKVFQDSQILGFSSRILHDLVSGLKELRPRTMLKENTFDCIVRWTEVNLSERLNELPGLLKNIPLEDLPLKFLTETVSNHSLVKDSITCIEAVSEALALISERSQMPEKDDNLMILSQVDKFVFLRCFDWQTKLWRNIPNIPNLKNIENLHRRFSAATVVNRKDIVVICNSVPKSREVLESVDMFDWTSQTWKQLPKVPFYTSPVTCSMAFLDDHLYVIGKNSSTPDSEVACYSFETNEWQYIRPMNIPRHMGKLVAYGDYLYVFGGRTETVERYDPLSDEWTCIDNEPKQKHHAYIAAVTVHKNKIYVSSLYDESIDEFDPETNTWIQHSQVSFAGSLESVNGQLLLAKRGTKWIYNFDWTTKDWAQFMEIRSENCFLFAGAFD